MNNFLDYLLLAGSVLGGLGLFLLAVGMMTDGLKLAAGSALRQLLSKWSRTPLHGIFSGMFMTAIVQSSSAVTVASLGFVNAGLIQMRQALGIIYGANIGTTMTGWLVALIGFKFNVQAFALPLIGVGMILRLINKEGRAASVGLALVGFGLFFVGIDVLKTAFEGIVATFDMSKITAEGISGIFVFLLIGIVMTILTQSSSASIALTITAASSGLVGLYAAGAMVIGANVGTTSTAALASIGATSSAKRLAAAQVIFNIGTGMVALVLLPAMFWFIAVFEQFFSMDADVALSLALFHTVFNVMGVLLIYPLNTRLADFLETRFKTREEMISKPRFLDNTVAQTPVLAVNALMLELNEIKQKVSDLYAQTVDTQNDKLAIIQSDAHIIRTLSAEVARFIVNIERNALSEETTKQLTMLMRVEQYFLTCAGSCEKLAHALRNDGLLQDDVCSGDVLRFFADIHRLLESTSDLAALDEEGLVNLLSQLQQDHDQLKSALIFEATKAQIPIGHLAEYIAYLAETLKIAQNWAKAIKRLLYIHDYLNQEHNSDTSLDTSSDTGAQQAFNESEVLAEEQVEEQNAQSANAKPDNSNSPNK